MDPRTLSDAELEQHLRQAGTRLNGSDLQLVTD
jgi:hypothetical protein